MRERIQPSRDGGKGPVGDKLIITTPDQATVHIQLRADYILAVDKHEKFKITDMVNPPDEPFTLLDLPLAVDVTDKEFEKIADLKLAEQVIAGGYTFLRVE